VILPIALPLRLFQASIPPALHIAIFLSLLPLLGLFSISAGVLVARWLPTEWSEPAFLQYGEGKTPYAYTVIRNLKPGQPYDINVQLVVPTTQANYDIGNFMTTLTLLTTSNRTIVASRRPALLIPYSRSLSHFTPAVATVVVPLFDEFVPSYSTILARLEIGRADSWRTRDANGANELAIIESRIRGNVKLRGLTALLALSPTTTTVATSLLFFFTGALLALLLYLAYSPSFSGTPSDQTVDDALATSPTEGPLPLGKPHRRPSRDVKTESETGPEPTLRRRRSRLSGRSASTSSSTGFTSS